METRLGFGGGAWLRVVGCHLNRRSGGVGGGEGGSGDAAAALVLDGREPGPTPRGRHRDGAVAQRAVTNPAPGRILRARSAVPAAAAGERAGRPEGGAAW